MSQSDVNLAPESFEDPLLHRLPPGKVARNMMHFARCLRAAGLPVGPGKVLDAIRAIEAVGFTTRQDFYWTLFAVFVNRRDQKELFDQAFHIFWKNPKILERMMEMMLPQLEGPNQAPPPESSRRLSEALAPDKRPGIGEGEEEEQEVELDAALTFSEREVLHTKDFEQMSAEEIANAKRALKAMTLPLMQRRTRRHRPDPHGRRVDMRATLRQSLRAGGASIDLRRKTQRTRTPPLVVICDISGSMSRYSRMLLHFLHTLTNDRDRVHSFLFGTRLTNITRYLRQRDIDLALKAVGEIAEDWEGGTRIAHCLRDFNRHWSRRVLSQGAVTLLITDGLDRDAGEGLAFEMERLHKSSAKLIWLNPLLRYDGYQPITAGAKAMLPHIDLLRSVHNLESLQQLADILSVDAPLRRDTGSAGRPRA